jgi:hypothetical protein
VTSNATRINASRTIPREKALPLRAAARRRGTGTVDWGLASASQDAAAATSIIEFTEDEVRTLLGSPSSASRSGGATFWSYDGTSVGSVSVEFVAARLSE